MPIQKSLDALVVRICIPFHATCDFTQARRSGFENPLDDPGRLLSTIAFIKKILHKWQKLCRLIHGNLLYLGSVVSLIQYRRFPLSFPCLSELMSVLQESPLDKLELLFYNQDVSTHTLRENRGG